MGFLGIFYSSRPQAKPHKKMPVASGAKANLGKRRKILGTIVPRKSARDLALPRSRHDLARFFPRAAVFEGE
jgi:hypothetical protein